MSQAKELSKQEKIASVPGLLEKIARCQPRIVCFIGLDMSTIVRNRAVGGTGPQKPGLMEFKLIYPESQAGVKETLFWAVPSTSGLVAGYSVCLHILTLEHVLTPSWSLARRPHWLLQAGKGAVG
jgi:hypothetical protein